MICLMPMCAYLSETSRMIQIYKALVARGVEVRVATQGGVHEERLRAEGIPYDIVGPHMSVERGAQYVRDNAGMGDPLRSMYAPDEMRAYVAAEVEYFRRHDIRGVVTGFTLTALISTRVVGIPIITEHAGAFLPPLFERGLLPAATNSKVPIFRYIPNWLARSIQNKRVSSLKIHLSGFNGLADELGVDRIPSFPALILGDLVLITEAPEVYGVSDKEMQAWRPQGSAYWRSTRFRYAGPLFAELDMPVPDTIEKVLAGTGPMVYVAMTSVPASMVRRVVRGVAASGAHVIVAGTVHDLGDLEGPRVTVGGVLPSQKIMPRVDLAVTTGGQGSVQCAMAAGTPLIGIPLHWEQDANVHFLEQRGAARLLPIGEIEDRKLGALVREMLNGPCFREAARRIQTIYAGYDGPALCASAILECLDRADAERAARGSLQTNA
jgi:UDP:flavonoid glycosyltransferase YjiC (YdhE family)